MVGATEGLKEGAMVKVYVVLDDHEAEALTTLAQCELRYPKEQIRLLVREGLQKRGLLKAEQKEQAPCRTDSA